jgi:hypothetical protein
MHYEARFRAAGARTLRRLWGTRAGHGQGHARPRTANKEWSCHRPPLSPRIRTAPAARRQGPGPPHARGKRPVATTRLSRGRASSSPATRVTVTTPPGAAEPLCRTLLVTSSLASESAGSESTRDFPSALATKSRAARTCSGTAWIVTLWRNFAADIKDADPPWPAPALEGHRAEANAGRMAPPLSPPRQATGSRLRPVGSPRHLVTHARLCPSLQHKFRVIRPMKAIGLDLFLIGLDHRAPGISTDSARAPEMTGNNRHDPGKPDTRRGRLAAEWNGPSPWVNDRYIRTQRYRTSSPVTVRPISIRWISLVPSKMVKIFASRCQRSTGYSRV